MTDPPAPAPVPDATSGQVPDRHGTSEGAPELHDGGPTAHDPHGADDHGTDTEHDDHAHMDEPLGPIDWAAWGVGVGGVAIGLVIAAAFAMSTGLIAT